MNESPDSSPGNLFKQHTGPVDFRRIDFFRAVQRQRRRRVHHHVNALHGKGDGVASTDISPYEADPVPDVRVIEVGDVQDGQGSDGPPQEVPDQVDSEESGPTRDQHIHPHTPYLPLTSAFSLRTFR